MTNKKVISRNWEHIVPLTLSKATQDSLDILNMPLYGEHDLEFPQHESEFSLTLPNLAPTALHGKEIEYQNPNIAAALVQPDTILEEDTELEQQEINNEDNNVNVNKNTDPDYIPTQFHDQIISPVPIRRSSRIPKPTFKLKNYQP